MTRLICTVLMLVVVAAGGAAATASADVYCVADPGCVGTAQTTVQAALDAAAVHAGPDAVQIGPGTFTAVGPNGFTSSSNGGSVDVRGAGRGLTTLTAPPVTSDTDVTVIRLSVTGSSLHDLKIVLPGNTAGFGVSDGVVATGTAIDRIDIVPAATGSNYTGITFTGTLRDSTVSVPVAAGGAAAVRVNDSGTGVIEDCTLSGFYAVYSDTFQATPTSVTVRRSRLSGGPYALYARASAVTVESTQLTSSTAGAVGILLGARANAPATASVRGATISGVATGVLVTSGAAGATISATVSSTVIRATGTSLQRTASGGGTANLTTTYSDYTPPPAGASTGTGTLTQTPGNTNVADARFLDAAAGDFRLRLDSPLRDAGDPAALVAGESTTDLAGGSRVVDGDGDGSARRDVGAFEYQRRAPVVAATVSRPTAAIGETVTFDGSASQDPDPQEALTFAWTFDDGTTAPGPTVQHAFATAGTHSASLTVTDPTGQGATATVTLAVAAPVPPPVVKPPATKPVLTKLKLTPTRFRAAGASASKTGTAKAPVGTRLSFTVSEAATVTFALQRKVTGRRSGAACKAPSAANRKGKSCTRYVAVKGSLTRNAKAGATAFRFAGRFAGRTLLLGGYRFTATARDAAGNTSATKRVSFTVAR